MIIKELIILGTSNLIIRLIDVVFILLFGFIAISQIGFHNSIEPPRSTEAVTEAPENAHTVVIGITRDGTFPIEKENLILKNINELRQYLTKRAKQAEREGGQLGIRIRASWDSPVEHGLAAARVCRDMGLPKGLDVVRFSSR